MKIAISVNSSWNISNFRSGLIRSLLEAGMDVIAIAPPDESIEQLKNLGCRYIPIAMDTQGTRPDRDFILLLAYYKILKSERPDVFLGYTVKPNVYGSLAAGFLGIPVINNIAGLGAVFIKDGWLVKLVRALYKTALKRSRVVFFQNNDDRQLFIRHQLVNAKVTQLIPGSGIDLRKFTVKQLPIKLGAHAPFRFLLIARMLWDKGVGEFVQAAALLKERYPQAEFCLLGFLDVENPAAISRAQMNSWLAQGHVQYLGVTNDVRGQIEAADCVVLPSYREGTPRTLLEAAAMGRPIITTNATGCREVVDDTLNGYLCEVRSAPDLARKMEQMMCLGHEARISMATYGRQKIERQFDEELVIKAYLDAIESARLSNQSHKF